MNIPTVEDVESVHPLELDDEVESLPAYEESVSSGLSTFGGIDSDIDVDAVLASRDPAYVQRGGSDVRRSAGAKSCLERRTRADTVSG